LKQTEKWLFCGDRPAERVTVLLNRLRLETVIEVFTEPPWGIDNEFGLADIEKS